MRDYSLKVISNHEKFKGQTIVPYFVDGIDTIGVWGNEEFSIEFTNHTSHAVQVRLSLDGTDVLTAQPASMEPKGKMFMVKPYKTMTLQAWPETNEKGARFIFGQTANSVAVHTHGDLSNKGIIAAAVYVEGYVPPPTSFKNWYPEILIGECIHGIYPENTYLNYNGQDMYDSDCARGVDLLGPAVGAGETIKQTLVNVQGFREPKLDRTLRMRQVWWDDLQAKIGKYSTAQSHPSGFKEPEQQLVNLASTPRIERTRFVVAQRTV